MAETAGLTKGIVEKIVDKYTIKVRIPVYNKAKGANGATQTEDLYNSTICTLANYSPNIRVGDIVYVGFENNEISQPVILGYLYRSAASNTLPDMICSSITAQSAKFTGDVQIGKVSSEEIELLTGLKGNVQAQINLLETKIKSESEKVKSSTICKNDVEVDTTFWIANPERDSYEEELAQGGYVYAAEIPFQEATEETYPEVTLPIDLTTNTNISPMCNSYAGCVVIYAKTIPQTDMILPTVTITGQATTMAVSTIDGGEWPGTGSTRISLRRGNSVPSASNLNNYELGWDKTNKVLYINDGGNIRAAGSSAGSGYITGVDQDKFSVANTVLSAKVNVANGLVSLSQDGKVGISLLPTATTVNSSSTNSVVPTAKAVYSLVKSSVNDKLGATNGIAQLDNSGTLKTEQIPSSVVTSNPLEVNDIVVMDLSSYNSLTYKSPTTLYIIR